MRKLTSTLAVGIMLLSMFAFAAAQYEISDERTYTEEEVANAKEILRIDMQERRDGVDENETLTYTAEEIQEAREILRTNLRETKNLSRDKVALRRINAEISELQEKKLAIRTRLRLESEGQNGSLRARLSNGRNAQIKIMPEVASKKALQRLRLKRCNESENCTIELKEVGEGNKTRAVYEARARKTFKIFGFIKNREEVRTRIDAETGEEIEVRRPWWAWMAKEPEETTEAEENEESEDETNNESE
jgi:hypothetical protein